MERRETKTPWQKRGKKYKTKYFDVLKQLKEDPGTKGIPVIILTNLEGMEDVDKAIGLGATTYLVKAKYTLEEVLEKIKKALGE